MTMSIRDTVQRSINRSNRKIAFWSILAIIAGIIGFVGSAGKKLPIPDTDIVLHGTSDFLLHRFGPVRVLTVDDLTKITADQLPLFNVSIQGDQMIDSGWTQENTTTLNGIQTSSSTAYFGYMGLGEKILIVRTRAKIDENVTQYSGVLSEPVEIGKDVYNDVLSKYPEYRSNLLPLMLDPAYDPIPWFMGLAAEGVLVLGGLAGLATAIGRRNPENHPIMKRLGRFGDTEGVMSQIDSEMMSGQVDTVDKLQFTRNWIILKSGNDMNFARISDVVWAYQYVIRQNYSKNFHAYIWTRDGQMLDVPSKEKKVNAMLTAVLQRAPWAIAGYNKDVEKSWKVDRAGFVRTVDDRRTKMSTPQ